MNDLSLRCCSPLARAVWIDMLCLMHQGVPYGHLANIQGSLQMNLVAGRCGVTPRQLASALSELEAHQVLSRNDNGVIFSRRMVRDERNRIARGEGGRSSIAKPPIKPPLYPPFVVDTKPPFSPEEVKEEGFSLEPTNTEETSTAPKLEVAHDAWYREAFWNRKNRKASITAYKSAVSRLSKERGLSTGEACKFLFSAAIDDQQRFQSTEDWRWRSKMYPATWLNGNRWEDQISVVIAPQLAQNSRQKQALDEIERRLLRDGKV